MLLGLILSFASCHNYIDEEECLQAAENKSAAEDTMTRSGVSEPTVEYEVLPNPYALSVMQSVYDDSGISEPLEPTDLYVRFLPADSLQLNSLVDDFGLELFDAPLDISIPEGETYVDPARQEGDFSWMYTTVKPDFVFPEGIRHEIIEECYIPDDNEEIVPTKGGTAISVEEAAFLKMGYAVEPDTKAGAYPSGTIRVYDDSLRRYVPVKGVGILCHTIVKWATASTDENGHYTISDKKFLIKPFYSVRFKNIRDFTIWGDMGPLAVASYKFGKHEKTGFSFDFDKDNNAWAFAAINNSAYEYYDYCHSIGIPTPPENLKIWRFRNYPSSSAPMLRRINGFITFSSNTVKDLLGVAMVVPNLLVKIFSFLMPDITVGTTDSSSFESIFESVSHELSHSSHFQQVGSDYWTDYINYIITYGCYGDGTGYNHEVCGIGEMWGYSMGYRIEYEKYKNNVFSTTGLVDGWIHKSVFLQLMDRNILTPKEIFDCLLPEIRTYDSLVSKMYEKYPEKADDIESVLENDKLFVNVQKPVRENVLQNVTISDSRTVIGEDLTAQNIIIRANGSLTLIGKSITVNEPFVVEENAEIDFNLK